MRLLTDKLLKAAVLPDIKSERLLTGTPRNVRLVLLSRLGSYLIGVRRPVCEHVQRRML